MLNYARLRELLEYDPMTGIFKWRIYRAWQSMPGKVAGYATKRGYVHISVDQKSYKAHRLAWLYVHGIWPDTAHLDHINGNPADNRIANLRLATPSQNGMNSRRYQNNTSGFKGVTKGKRDKMWRAQIKKAGVLIQLGRFETPEQAHVAYCAAAVKLHRDYRRTE